MYSTYTYTELHIRLPGMAESTTAAGPGCDMSISYALPFSSRGCGTYLRGSGLRVQGSGFRVQGPGFRVQGAGCA